MRFAIIRAVVLILLSAVSALAGGPGISGNGFNGGLGNNYLNGYVGPVSIISTTPGSITGVGLNGAVNPTSTGAAPAATYNTGTTTAASATFTDPTNHPWTSSDVGKVIVIFGAKAAPDWATPVAYSRTTILQPTVNNAGHFLVWNGVAGTSAASAPTWNQSERGLTVEDTNVIGSETLVASASGTQFIFRGNFAHGALVPNKVTIKVNGTTVATDDGSGNLVDSGSGTYSVLTDSKVGYSMSNENPTYYLHFLPNKLPAAAQAVTAAYDYGPAWVTFKDTGLPLVTTIKAVPSASQITLNTNADIAITGTAAYVYGTDSTAGIQAAINQATQNQGSAPLTRGGIVEFPQGLFLTTGEVDIAGQGLEIRGFGWGPWNNGTGAAGGTTIMCISCVGTSVFKVTSGTWRLFVHDLRLDGLQGSPPNYLLEYVGLNTQNNQISRVMFGGERAFSEPNYYASTVSELGYTFGSPAGNDNHNNLSSNVFYGLEENYAIDVANTQAADSVSTNDFFNGWNCGNQVACEIAMVRMNSSYWQFNSPVFLGTSGDGWFSYTNNVGSRVTLINATAQNSGRIVSCRNTGGAQDDLTFQLLSLDTTSTYTPADGRIINCSGGPQIVRVVGTRFSVGTGSPSWSGVWNADLSGAVYGEFIVDGIQSPNTFSELNLSPSNQTGSVTAIHVCGVPDPGAKTDIICMNQAFKKGDALSFHNFDTAGAITGFGGLTLTQLAAPAANTCTVNGAGASTCKYEWTACQDLGCTGETTVSSAITCSSTASPPTDNLLRVQVGKGIPAYRLYRNDCSGGSSYSLVPTPFTNNTVPVSAMTQTGQLGYDDTNYGALGAAAPTVNTTGLINYGMANVSLGGGAAPTLGTIGNNGPQTAAQNSWLQIRDSTGASAWIPLWK